MMVEPSVVVHTFDPSTQEAEAGGSLSSGQPGLHRESLCPKINNKEDGRMVVDILIAEWYIATGRCPGAL